jgi:5-bromo-4-chloroindolyl phosphate hydrolysis protein
LSQSGRLSQKSHQAYQTLKHETQSRLDGEASKRNIEVLKKLEENEYMQSLPKEALKTIIQKPAHIFEQNRSLIKTLDTKLPLKTSHRKQRLRSDAKR